MVLENLLYAKVISKNALSNKMFIATQEIMTRSLWRLSSTE
jgi:hypothetical protein